ncbi:MAG: phosphoribosylformylglycinamidine synthase [Hyphomicrobiales bacterium]
MIVFFQGKNEVVYAVDVRQELSQEDHQKLSWLFGNASQINSDTMKGLYIGPRKEMITPWSTNAVEITQNMGINGIFRIEEFHKSNSEKPEYDPMLQACYQDLEQSIFEINFDPEPIKYIEDIKTYNAEEGLALNEEEIDYLENVSKSISRKLTDSEVYGFAQVNSEHCRHKIFNGTFIIDGEKKNDTLFALIKKTSQQNPNTLVSAYKDNVAFVLGPKIEQFAPESQDKPEFFTVQEVNSVLSIKAETHNFPTTVEPFNGASTGTGGEIRDRLAGGKGSYPLAGTAVYMTSYPRLDGGRSWEKKNAERKWLYQSPKDILIKASNGASDFGNKFGQPLINGSLLTFEHTENDKMYGFDKVIMLAGGIGYAKKEDSLKQIPEPGDIVVLLGGDNYRIGMGGGAVSSVATGEFGNSIELNAVQRANPEMQKRVANAIRAMAESGINPIVSIHDHGAGGHLNCFSELVEETGGEIDLGKLPVGDPTLSAKEIVGNESQERMGLVIKNEDADHLEEICKRERAPFYKVGKITDDNNFKFSDDEGRTPIDLKLEYLFGKPPKTILEDKEEASNFAPVSYDQENIIEYIKNVLQIEAVACKDWLTNKVDRSVTGKVAMQQCAGAIQVPINNLGISALDYKGKFGMATAMGHAPIPALIDPKKGSRLAIGEALTNIVWAPLQDRIKGVSLSANWMWPAKNTGENARLYNAVEAVSKFACELGVNIPTGKDSLSMTQKYPNGDTVYSPGTVIISAASQVTDIRKAITPALKPEEKSSIYYIDFCKDSFKLGGSSFAQTLNYIGSECPDIQDADYFKNAFNAVQELVENNFVLAGHDISAGGLITALFEMNFPNCEGGLDVELDFLGEPDIIKALFNENPGVLIQTKDSKNVESILRDNDIKFERIGKYTNKRTLVVNHGEKTLELDIKEYRDIWYKTSYLLDKNQSGDLCAKNRFENYKKQDLKFCFGKSFTGKFKDLDIDPARKIKSGTKAAIIREKGVNGDREMAYSLHLAGFDVKDVHMTDLINGRETLEDVNMIVFVGGFSNSDVLGSAKGWAGAILHNKKAKAIIDKFYAREDTLSLGICNGCQLMMELGLIYPNHPEKVEMKHNDSMKFESGFICVDIKDNDSVMLESLSGRRLGVWVAHGEGKFSFPYFKDNYKIVSKYTYESYPGNPNGSDWAVAAVASNNGRHLAMMPHLERAVFPWQWAHYPYDRKGDEVTPWVEAFANAKKWIEKNK